MRKILFSILISLTAVSSVSAATWWVPGHYQGRVYITGHTRGTAGWLSPHWNFTPAGGYWVAGHYTNPLPRLYPAYPTSGWHYYHP